MGELKEYIVSGKFGKSVLETESYWHEEKGWICSITFQWRTGKYFVRPSQEECDDDMVPVDGQDGIVITDYEDWDVIYQELEVSNSELNGEDLSNEQRKEIEDGYGEDREDYLYGEGWGEYDHKIEIRGEITVE